MSKAMPTAAFVSKVLRTTFDPAVVFFCILIALPLTFGLTLLGTIYLIVPAILLIVFSTSATMKYATMVARALALGYDVPSAESAVFDYLRMPWATAPWFAITIVVTAGAVVFLKMDASVFRVYCVIAVVLVPAIIAVVSVNCRPLSMFRIIELVKVIRILGIDYLKLLACWSFVFLADLSRWLPVPELPRVFAWSIVLLQLMLLFVAAGVLLFHHREALGVPVEREEKSVRMQRHQDKAQEAERRAELNRAYVFFSRGNSVGGLSCIRDYLANHNDNDTWAWFADEVGQWESHEPMLMFARNYFSHLSKQDDREAASQLLVSCINLDKHFAPHADDRAYARELLAGHALESLSQAWR